MKSTYRIVLASLSSVLLAASPMPAQTDEELILDNRPSAIQAAPRPKPTRTPAATPKADESVAPTPRPEDVIVGIVNNRVLTRAELNVRVADQYDRLKKEVQARFGGVVTTIDPEFKDMVIDLEEDPNEVLEEQRDLIDKAIRAEESSTLQSWVEHSLLADEARRQKLVISEAEFRARLAEAEAMSELDQKTIDAVLDHAKVSRGDYEKSVYDALLIEKLIAKFISLNYTDEQYKAAYDSNPAIFYEPPKYQLAHFAMALDSSTDSKLIDDRRAVAEKVREALKTTSNPKEVFDQPAFNDETRGFGGVITRFLTLDENILPPIVQVRGRELKAGEVSDVLINKARENGKVVTRSIHVVKMIEVIPETGTDFESARPAIMRNMTEIARTRLLERLREAKTHRIITNLSGVPASKVPSAEQLRTSQANAEPINLVLPNG
ncbi:hypothetical protein GC173_10895 [bacterium]|nr:hypothetical protein [bacterium]